MSGHLRPQRCVVRAPAQQPLPPALRLLTVTCRSVRRSTQGLSSHQHSCQPLSLVSGLFTFYFSNVLFCCVKRQPLGTTFLQVFLIIHHTRIVQCLSEVLINADGSLFQPAADETSRKKVGLNATHQQETILKFVYELL